MKLLRAVSKNAALNQGVVATIGTFDGVHLGHQHLITSLKNKANALSLPLVVILFEPQPREYFLKDKAPARLSSLREKLLVLKECQVDYVYCISFTEKLAQTSAVDFANDYLFAGLQVKYLLAGADFRFGKNREGDLALLKTMGAEKGCEVQLASDFCIIDDKISSTKVRQALQEGNFALASRYLGRAYSLMGRVIPGDGRGRQWGIPTANLNTQRQSLPLQGVYLVEVLIEGQLVKGIANIGLRPTVDGSKTILEVHLLDFNQSVYGKIMQVFFLQKVRDEIKFTTVQALIAQIHEDIAQARQYFTKQGSSVARTLQQAQ